MCLLEKYLNSQIHMYIWCRWSRRTCGVQRWSMHVTPTCKSRSICGTTTTRHVCVVQVTYIHPTAPPPPTPIAIDVRHALSANTGHWLCPSTRAVSHHVSGAVWTLPPPQWDLHYLINANALKACIWKKRLVCPADLGHSRTCMGIAFNCAYRVHRGRLDPNTDRYARVYDCLSVCINQGMCVCVSVCMYAVCFVCLYVCVWMCCLYAWTRTYILSHLFIHSYLYII